MIVIYPCPPYMCLYIELGNLYISSFLVYIYLDH